MYFRSVSEDSSALGRKGPPNPELVNRSQLNNSLRTRRPLAEQLGLGQHPHLLLLLLLLELGGDGIGGTLDGRRVGIVLGLYRLTARMRGMRNWCLSGEDKGPTFTSIPMLMGRRQRSATSISEADEDPSDDGEGDISGAVDQALLAAEVTRSGSGRSVAARRSIRSAREETPDDSIQEVERPTSPTTPAAPIFAPVGSTLSRAIGSIGSLTRRGWGEAPTYLEAMSSPEILRDVEAEADVPLPRQAPPQRGSTIRDFLARAGGSFRAPRNPRPMSERPGSQISLLLQPQTSRLSTQTLTTSSISSPWASTHSLNISSPVPNTALRASFDIPRAGLSDDQMRYISTPEAVNLVGVKLGEPPVGRRRRRSSAAQPGTTPEGETAGDAPPPTWEQVDDERRRNEADVRRGLARPVGQEDEREGGGTRGEGETEGEVESVPERSTVTRTEAAPSHARKESVRSPPTLGIFTTPFAPTVEIEPPTPIAANFNAS